jgi:serine/threonine protein kinase/tetratricopeptide (TPR) repeat protein
MMRWDPRATEIASKVAELASAGERESAIREACAGDDNLAYLVRALLKAYETASDVLAAGNDVEVTVDTVEDPSTDRPCEPGDPDAPGTWIGPYRLVRLRGEGGMGCVWEAEQLVPIERRVALKLIKSGRDSSQILRRFNAERQALARMNHPNIARVLDAGAAEGGKRPYFAMELVPGVPVTRFCDQERLDTRRRLEIFLDVCAAVQHAHQKGVIHRDLKPSNILVALVDGEPTVKVIDFGVAKATQGRLVVDPLTTEFGNIVGTLEYMAPEQAEPDNLDIDTRADIYSLGVVLYELLVGSTPFSRRQFGPAYLTELIRAIREVDPPKPSTRLSKSDDLVELARHRGAESRALSRLVEGDLDWIVMKCLEKERSRRYETASELGADLRRCLADEPVLAGPPSAGYKLKKFLRRHRAQAIVAALLGAVFTLGAAGTAAGYVRARAENAAMTVQRDRAQAAEKEAEQERDAVEGVLDFVNFDLILQRDSVSRLAKSGGGNPNLTIRQALDNAAKRTARRLKDPLVLARVREAIGVAYLELGACRDAKAQLEAARASLEELLPPEHRLLLRVKSELASVQSRLGDSRSALRLLEKVLEIRREILPPGHPDVVAALNRIGYVHFDAGEFAAAADWFRQARDASSEDLADDIEAMLIQANLAGAERATGKFDRARKRYEEILPQLEALAPPDSVDLAVVRDGYALALAEAGEAKRALPIIGKNLAVFRNELSPEHHHALQCEENLAFARLKAGERAAAVRDYRTVSEKWDRSFGAEYPSAVKCRYQLGYSLWGAQGIDAALPVLRDAADRADVAAKSEAAQGFDPRADLAAILLSEERYEDAATEFARIVKREADAGAATGVRAQETALSLAICQRRIGKLPEARDALRRIRARFADGASPNFRANVQQVLSLVEFDLNDFASAEAAARAAIDGYRALGDAVRTESASITAGAALALRAVAANKSDPVASRRLADEAFELLDGNLKTLDRRGRPGSPAELKSRRELIARACRGLAASCEIRGESEQAARWKARSDDAAKGFARPGAAKNAKSDKAAP